MANQSKIWAAVYNCFDPLVILSGDRLRAWHIEREGSPLKRLITSLQPECLPQKVLLVGQMGSGKTSELFKLVSLLQKDYLTVYLDLYGSLDINTSSRLELLFCLGAAIYKAASDAGVEIPHKAWDDLVSSLSTLVREQTQRKGFQIDPMGALAGILTTASLELPALAVVGSALGQGVQFNFGMTRQDVERLEVGPVMPEIFQRVNAIIELVEKKAGKNLLLIADGLDKVSGSDQARLLLERNWFLTNLKCRAIYTIPLGIYYSPIYNEMQHYYQCVELPNIRLHSRDDREKRYEAGYALMRSLVEKRLQGAGLELDNVIEAPALNQLIQASGGLIRDMVRLVREASQDAQETGLACIDSAAAGRTANKVRKQMEAPLFAEHFQALEEIDADDGLIKNENPYQLELLRRGYILNYENGGVWHELHPLALKIIRDHRQRLMKRTGAQDG